jgi:serine/threonine protein kinase
VKVCTKCFTEAPDDTYFCPNCGESLPSAEEDQHGLIGRTVAGKFRIMSVVGEGAMGSIYKAEQTTLGKTVCIKVLHQHLSGDKTISKRFHREARAASRIKHANAINIIDFGTAEDGTHYIAMDYIDGRDLAHLIKEEFPVEPERVFHMVDQICSALDEAHAQGVIHRDLKPENIMIEDRRHQKDFVTVLDFGIAKIKDPSGENPDTFHTMAGIVCGTPEYMSPEQARGESLDARSDIYSLGVIMYHMFTGKLPFTADTPIGVVTKHLTQEPPRPRDLNAGLSPAIEGLILQLMAKNRDLRPKTCLEVKQAIQEVRERLASGDDAFDQTTPMTRPSKEELEKAGARPFSTSPYSPSADEEETMVVAGKSRAGLWFGLFVLLVALGVGGYFAYDRFFASKPAGEGVAEGEEQAGTNAPGSDVGERPASDDDGPGGQQQQDRKEEKQGLSQAEVLKLMAFSRTLQEQQLAYAQYDRMLAMRLAEWRKRDAPEKLQAIEALQAAASEGRQRVAALQKKVDSAQLTNVGEGLDAEQKLVDALSEKAEAILAEELPPLANGQEEKAAQKLEELTAQITASRQELARHLTELDEKKKAWAETPETRPLEELEALQSALRALDADYDGLLAKLSEENVADSAVQYGKRLGKQDVFKEQVAAALAREVGPTREELARQAEEERRLLEEKKKKDEEKRRKADEERKKREAEDAKRRAEDEKRRAAEEAKRKAEQEKASKEQAKVKAAEFERLGDEAKSQASYAKAIAYYKQALKLRSSAGLHKKLGKTYNSKGDHANGAKHLRTYLKLMGSNLSETERKLIESQIRD